MTGVTWKHFPGRVSWNPVKSQACTTSSNKEVQMSHLVPGLQIWSWVCVRSFLFFSHLTIQVSCNQTSTWKLAVSNLNECSFHSHVSDEAEFILLMAPSHVCSWNALVWTRLHLFLETSSQSETTENCQNRNLQLTDAHIWTYCNCAAFAQTTL